MLGLAADHVTSSGSVPWRDGFHRAGISSRVRSTGRSLSDRTRRPGCVIDRIKAIAAVGPALSREGYTPLAAAVEDRAMPKRRQPELSTYGRVLTKVGVPSAL
ncbi:MAG: hypothetical protein KC431_21555, partial [Myxococcales bacterium]|nr:hypothetical protein [Myxococcales bacterium]